VVLLDQVSLEDCGLLTRRVRERLAELGQRDAERPALADSRERIGMFQGVCLKPNEREAMRATGCGDHATAGAALASRVQRAVFLTRGERGIFLAFSDGSGCAVDGFPVAGPIDPVGAGDSTSAGIICALAAGATPIEAAALGNLVASVTVRKLGTTGTATPAELRARWAEVLADHG
jgi:sugar/nucleoside kinase (ribokinase family)